MFDERRFRAQLVLKGLSMEDVAEKLGINTETFRRKVRRGGDFTRDEMVAQFYENEVPTTPKIMDFASGVVGTDSQLQAYFNQQYRGKMVRINRKLK